MVDDRTQGPQGPDTPESHDHTLVQKDSLVFPDWSGKDLGDFRVDKLVAHGGMAVVYQAFQKELDRQVALKVLPTNLSGQKEFQGLFVQEAKVLANLSHPNIVPIYSYGQHENCPYFAMELIRGETLKEKIARRKKALFKGRTLFPVPDILRWIRPVAMALQYAHDRGVVHCDIKPGNIMIDQHERIFVADFGLVRVVQAALALEAPCGTPSYMSWEQASGVKDLDGRSDIYSMGCVLYELLTGVPPFVARTLPEILDAFDGDKPPAPAAMVPTLPLLLDQIVVKALEKDRDKRYQSMGEFLAVLDQFSSGKLQARLDSKLNLRSRRPRAGNKGLWKKMVLAAAMMALLAGLGYVFGWPMYQRWEQGRDKDVSAWCRTQWQIAENYKRNGLNDLAERTFQRIVDKYPHHPLAKKAQEALEN